VLALTSTKLGYFGIDDLLVFETPQSEVGIVDLATGASLILPYKKPVGGMIAADRNHVIYREPVARTHGAGVLIWSIHVPRDPVALSAWLLGITNAKPVANSDTVAYP